MTDPITGETTFTARSRNPAQAPSFALATTLKSSSDAPTDVVYVDPASIKLPASPGGEASSDTSSTPTPSLPYPTPSVNHASTSTSVPGKQIDRSSPFSIPCNLDVFDIKEGQELRVVRRIAESNAPVYELELGERDVQAKRRTSLWIPEKGRSHVAAKVMEHVVSFLSPSCPAERLFEECRSN